MCYSIFSILPNFKQIVIILIDYSSMEFLRSTSTKFETNLQMNIKFENSNQQEADKLFISAHDHKEQIQLMARGGGGCLSPGSSDY